MESATLESLEIGGVRYDVRRLDDQEWRTFRLVRGNGHAYDVVETPGRTVCDCSDFKYRHADLDFSDGCKHIKALVAEGIARNVSPYDATPPVRPAAGQSALFGDQGGELAEATTPAPTPAPRAANLAEKYRPARLADIVGQGGAVADLREFADAPYPTAFLFEGASGVGKTSLAVALAGELGCDVDKAELGGVYSIKSGDQTADNVRDTLRSLRLRPMFGSGWKVLVVNEADLMSKSVQYLWLDALEEIPPRTVVVFTSNYGAKFERRFVSRCERFRLLADPALMRAEVQCRINSIWHAETGRTDAPRVEDIPDAIQGGELSIRDAVLNLAPMIRAARRATPADAPRTPPVRPAAADQADAPPPPADAPRGDQAAEPTTPAAADKWAGVDFQSLADSYRSGAKFMDLVRASGVPQSTLAKRLERLGIVFPVRPTKKG